MNPDKKPPKINQIQSPEHVSREEVINLLKLDPESPKTIEIYTKWYDQEYAKSVELGERSPYVLDWNVAELYIEAGQYKLAYDKLNELADTAWDARDDEWVNKANEKIDEINNRNK